MCVNLETLLGATLTAEELYRARIMMILLTINAALVFPFSIFGSVILAYERFIYIRVVNIIRVLLAPCIILPLLLLGYGSVMMVVVATTLNMLVFLIDFF